MKRTLRTGFTLVEIMITMVIFTVMIQAIYGTMVLSQRSWNDFEDSNAPKENVRMTMAAMVREIRGAENPAVTKHSHDLTMTFQHPLFGNVKYTWTDAGRDAHEIIRTADSHRSILAFHISRLDLSLPSTNNQVIVTVAGTTPSGNVLQLKEKVVLRMQTGLY